MRGTRENNAAHEIDVTARTDIVTLREAKAHCLLCTRTRCTRYLHLHSPAVRLPALLARLIARLAFHPP